MPIGEMVKVDLNKINTWRFISILMVVVAIFAMRECHVSEVNLGDVHFKLDNYQKKTMTYQKTINDQGWEIIKQQDQIIDRDQAIEAQLLENSELDKMNRQIQLQTEVSKSNFVAAYKPSNTTDFIEVHDTIYIKAGTEFTKTEEWFSVAGSVGVKGIEFDSINFPNELTLTLGYEKRKGLKGLFKEKPLVIEGVNTNPYLSTVGMQNISFKKPKKKWYETRAFAAGVGVLGGILIMK